jgi:flagellar basal body-associated protein FliL
VIFLDIVEYSKKTVEEQIILKKRFNTLIAETLTDIPVNDRIILDTGDGAAIGFLGDPEDALFVAMNIRDALNNEQATVMPDLRVRMGINLGPVKLIKDINNQLNLIGDGINIAQRIMSFAENGQLLVSRSYYDIVSCLSQEYAQLFQYKGARADKHIRDHYVYAVGHTGLLSVSAHHQPAEKASSVTAEDEINTAGEISSKNIINNGKTANNKPYQIRTNKKIMFIAVPVIAVIVVAIFFFILTGKDKLSFVKKSAQASRADTESEQVEIKPNVGSLKSEQVEIKPNVGSLNADGIDFIYNSIQSTNGKVTLSIRIRNNSSVEQSVALYDNHFTWPKSKLIDQTGKPLEVTMVNFTKGSQKITSNDAGTQGVSIKPHQTIRASLVFNKTGKGIKSINIHPFIYKGRWHWKEHDLPMRFSL